MQAALTSKVMLSLWYMVHIAQMSTAIEILARLLARLQSKIEP